MVLYWCQQMNLLRAIVDTNVVFEGVTRQGGACGWLVTAWLNGLYKACMSNALAHEYMDVLTRKLSPRRWQQIEPVLAELFETAELIDIHFLWRPSAADPGDEHIIDAAMNAGAIVVTWNLKDFQPATKSIGLWVMTPPQFMTFLIKHLDEQSQQS